MPQTGTDLIIDDDDEDDLEIVSSYNIDQKPGSKRKMDDIIEIGSDEGSDKRSKPIDIEDTEE